MLLFISIFFFTCCLADEKNFNCLFNQGVQHVATNQQAALQLFQQALTINPDSLETNYNCAYTLKKLGLMRQALPFYEYVLAKDPQNVSAHIGYAQACLATDNYGKGFAHLEWRHGHLLPETQHLADYIAAGNSLHNKIVLLRAEWGMGDTIMMLRYAKLLKNLGAIVYLHLMHEALIPLLSNHPYIDNLISPHHYPPPFHFQVPIMSLPYIFKTTVETIPTSIPYLTISQDLIDTWKEKIKHNKQFKIGICWQGNKIHGSEKWMPLSYFMQLAQLPQVQLYSLQKLHGLEEIATLHDKSLLITFDSTFDQKPFLDTAALMKNLDLVITIDTSIAHIAGALGIPVWVILHATSEWRWGLERTTCPWYPSMRLFRQRQLGQWQEVVDEIIESLKLRLEQWQHNR